MSYSRVFSVAPNQRGCVGGLIGKGGSKIRETKEATKAQIRYDQRQSQFVITGRVGQCDKAVASLSSQLATLMEKEIERQQRRTQSRFVPRRASARSGPTSSSTPKSRVSKPKKNGFQGLVADDGRTFEQVDAAAAAATAAAAAARRAAKVQKRQEIQDNQTTIGLVGVNWADMDSEDEDTEDSDMPTQSRYNPRDGISYGDWVPQVLTPAATELVHPERQLALGEDFVVAGKVYVKEADHDKTPYAW